MSTGDQNDIFNRLKANLVPWFGQDSPNVDALLKGVAKTDSAIYQLITDANTQARIKTATGDALDLISLDFFGGKLPRHPGENDVSFRSRILANIVQERATRTAMIRVLTNLTGRAPTVIDGWNTFDSCYYDQSYFYDINGGLGFLRPYTGIIYAYRPQPQGLTAIGGYDQTTFGGFGYDFFFNNAYIDLTQEIVFVTDQDILDAINNTKVYGTYIFVSIFD